MAVFCSICKLQLSSQSVYNRHLKLVHKQKNISIVTYNFLKYNAKCFECQHSFMNVSALRNHLLKKHAIDPEKCVYNFSSYEDFQIWYQNTCSEDKSHYVKEKGSNNSSSGKNVTYYKCHRSRTSSVQSAVSDGQRKRLKKSQGTCKMSSLCTSQIIVITLNDNYEVIYYKRHYNHGLDIEHLPISKQDRLKVANKLVLGVPPAKIFDDVIDNITDERECLIRPKDINNIRISYGVNMSSNGRRHKSDAISVYLWVQEEMNKNENNSVLFYKPQGESKEHFADKDFCLIFMNKSQQAMLERFGENIICIDSTHGLNKYDFELTTVLVVDEYGEGFPGAYMFSNRKDTFIFTFFFYRIKQKLGHVLKVKTVMTDITNVFINAWLNVMGSPQHYLYCSWHVDRAWQKNLCKIKDSERRDWAYKTLKYLQYEQNEREFDFHLNKTIELFCADNVTLEFGQYFKQYYGNNYQYWALCFRKDCGINTNMYIEAMHKVIKYSHLDGRVVSRLDKGLNAVLKYIKRKVVDRIQKNKKGKTTKKITNIINRHRLALISKLSIKATSTSTFIVADDKNKMEKYYVSKLSDKICCKMTCNFCNICIHCFNCTCLDYLRRNTICKHIHFILLHMPDNNTEEADGKYEQNKCDEDKAEVNTHLEYLGQNISAEATSLGTLKNKIKNQINDMQGKLENSCDENVRRQVSEYLKNANLLLNYDSSISRVDIPCVTSAEINEPPNKKIKKQLVFTSTKKAKGQ